MSYKQLLAAKATQLTLRDVGQMLVEHKWFAGSVLYRGRSR
jgi:hypothetical protein